MREKAIVMEVNNKSCTVLTSGGDFRVVRLKGDFRPGQEILLPERSAGILRYALAAACLAFIILTAGLWKFWTLPAVAAYVCLDINPSVEMALDGNSVVRKVNPLNEDGKKLIEGLDIEGKDVREAVQELIASAADKNYIPPGEEAVVMSSVIPADNGDPSVVDREVKESIESSLKKKNVRAEVVVLNASPQEREQAGQAGMSTGRYLLYLNAREQGDSVKPEDFKNKSIRSIEKEHRLKLNELAEANKSGQWQRTQAGRSIPEESGLKRSNNDNSPGRNNGKPASGRINGSKYAPPGQYKKDNAGDNTVRNRDPGGGGDEMQNREQQQQYEKSSWKDNSGKKQDKGKDTQQKGNNGQGDKEKGGGRGGR